MRLATAAGTRQLQLGPEWQIQILQGSDPGQCRAPVHLRIPLPAPESWPAKLPHGGAQRTRRDVSR